jgi:hypothetical protein
MDRRSFLKGGLAATAIAVTAKAALTDEEIADTKNTRKVFKIVHHKSVSHIRVGSDQWDPTADEIDSLVQAFVSAEEDAVSTVVGTRHDVKINTIYPGGIILVPVSFKTLKKGDIFVMYEETGELVEPERPVWRCLDDACMNMNKTWAVEADPVKDVSYGVPDTCPV